MRPHTTRFLLATLTAGACTLAMTGSATAAGTTGQEAPLRIMLTNDDGWDHPGITAIYDGLVAAGHEVTMVAPLTNNTGAGAALTTGGSLVVTHPEPGKYAVDGTPADTAKGVGLNVNYPYLAGGTGTPAGVKLAKSGASFYDYTYVNADLPAVGDTASFTLALVPQPADPGSDDDLLDRGYITITPIAGNYDIETPQAVLGKLNAIFRR